MRRHRIQHSAKISGIFTDFSNTAVQPLVSVTELHHCCLHTAFFTSHSDPRLHRQRRCHSQRSDLLCFICAFPSIKIFFLYLYAGTGNGCIVLCLFADPQKLFFTSGDQFADRISHRRKFLFILCHNISFYHFFFMMKVKCMRQEFPSFCLLYFLQ